jgi:hypothetical protein
MKPKKITIEYEDGTLWYSDNINDMRAIGMVLPNIHWKKTTTIAKLRNKYHALLEELCKNTESGYTKASLHEAMKPLIMKKFIDFPQFFTTGVPEYSTRSLNHEGWSAMIDQLRSTAYDVYNYVFKT